MKIFFTLFTLALSLGMFAQDFSGKATYQTKMIFKDFKDKSKDKKDGLTLSPEMMKQLENVMKSASERTFFLEFTKNESLYTSEEKLEQPKSGSNISISHSPVKLYKNVKENYSLSENEELDKPFLIKDTLHTLGWELSTENKKIGNYTAYKATKTVKPKNYFSDEEDKKENSEEKSSDLLSMIDKEPQDVVYTAWYTPEIPIPNGPEKFGGLPGLILELHTDNMVYLCSEIVLNPKKIIEIKQPKGKIISQEEHDEKVKKMYNNIMQNQKRQGKGNQTIFIMGG